MAFDQIYAAELPEFIGDVVSLVGPDLVNPLPAAVVLALNASEKLPDGHDVKANTPFASLPEQETACQFSTSWPLAVQPIKLTAVNLQALSRHRSRLTFELEVLGQPLNQWSGQSLALYEPGRAVVHDVLTVTGRVQGQSEEKHYMPTTDLLVEDDALKY